MRTRLSSVGSGATTRRTTCIGRSLSGRFVEGSVAIRTAQQRHAPEHAEAASHERPVSFARPMMPIVRPPQAKQ
jgi:hypothetical protein